MYSPDCSSRALEIVNVAIVMAIGKKSDGSARCCLGHILCPKKELIFVKLKKR
jgi:hypothetical protein